MVLDTIDMKPNYDTLLKRMDLSKEEHIWILLGVDPDAIQLEKKILNKLDRTDEEQKWLWKFEDYCRQINPFMYKDFTDYKKILHNTDIKIYQESYDNCIQIAPDNLEQLINKKLITKDEELEKYKNHYIYNNTPNTNNHFDNENHALAEIFNVNHNYFDRFINLANTCNNYINFSHEDKWFYSEFGKFISSYYDPKISYLVHQIKKQNLWDMNFSQYCENLHNAGFIFKLKTYNHLAQKNIHLSYSKEGWAYKFYLEWLERKPLWNLRLASEMYLGIDPYGKRNFLGFQDFQIGQQGYHLADINTVMFYDETGKWKDGIISSFQEDTSLKHYVQQYIQKGDLKASKNDNGEYEFEPKDITEFFKKRCPNTYQPKALFTVLGIETNIIENEVISLKKQKEASMELLFTALTEINSSLNPIEYTQHELAIALKTLDCFKSLQEESIINQYIKPYFSKKKDVKFKKGRASNIRPNLKILIQKISI